MRYTFWHGPTKSDMEWLSDTVQGLNRNEYTKPLYFDGAHWPGDDDDDPQAARQHAAIMLLNALRHNTSSNKLTFQNAPLDLKAQLAFSQSMQDNKSLTNLTLKQLTNCNECGDDDFNDAADNTSSSSSSSPPLTIPTDIFENPSLECLTISQCRLDYSACLALARMIHNPTATCTSSFKFHTLSLNQVDIEPQGLPHLFLAIAQSKTLHHLKLQDLSWKSATATAAQEEDAIAATTREFLTTAAAGNTSLVSLSMEHMQLNPALAKEVAALLKRNAVNLLELSLRHNDLNGDAIQVLVQDGLVHNTRLHRLYLSHNPVGDDGAKHLMQGLTPNGNTSLHELCLVETEIWQEGCMAILQGLRVGCRSLRKVHLDGNNLEACGLKAILAMLQENMVLYSLLETLPFLLRKQKACSRPLSSSSNDNSSSAQQDSWRQVDFMLRCNKAKRRFFMQHQYEGAAGSSSSSSPSNVAVSPSLLVPLVLTLQDSGATGTSASAQPDVLFSFLSACLPQTLMSRTTTASTCSTATATCASTTDSQQEQSHLQQPQDDVQASTPPTSGMKRRLRMGSSLPMISRIRRSSTPPSA